MEEKDLDMKILSADGNNAKNGQSKKIVCECVVCVLLIKGFSTLNFSDKLQLITKGRPKPPMKNLTTKMKNCIRHFYPEQHYEQYKWLTGCETIGKLFCWPCLLFEQEKGLWNTTGFSDLNNFHKALKRHVMSKSHLQIVIKEKVFGKTRIEHALDKQLEISHRQHNELVDKNRKILKRLIDVVCFLGQHELGFRGHDETRISSNKGNFQDLLSLMAKYDDCLKNHLEQSSVFRGTSNLIQNDLISAVATIILKKIKQEIDEARFMAIVLDETTDITNCSQSSIVIRYVDKAGNVQERFLGFKNLCENRTADALYSVVYDVIKEINGDKKLVAQSYDGAAVMAGQLGGLQAKVRESFPSALFVHCFAHKLNLVLSQSINHIKECKVFFAALSGMAAFFSKSTNRTQALDSIVRKRLPKVAPTRWNYDGRLVLTVSENREKLIEVFENIIENNETWDSETINSSRAFLDCFKRDFNFNFLLNIFSEIFPCSDDVFNVLQTKINDIALCLKKKDDFKSMLSKKRYDFHLFWEKTMALNLKPNAKRPRTDKVGDVQTSYRRLFYEIIDQIQQQINYRFNSLNDFKFLELCNFDAYKGKPFPEDAFKSLLLHYGQFFDRVLLRSELKVIYEIDDISAKNNAKELMQFLKDNELEDAYTEVSKLCELVLTIPATSSSVEGNFSTLKRIKVFVKNSTGQERLSQISFLSIENKLLQSLSVHPRFYDDVIDEFAKSDRRIELHYKYETSQDSPASSVDLNVRRSHNVIKQYSRQSILEAAQSSTTDSATQSSTKEKIEDKTATSEVARSTQTTDLTSQSSTKETIEEKNGALEASHSSPTTDLATQSALKEETDIDSKNYISSVEFVEDNFEDSLDCDTDSEMATNKRWREQDTIKFVKLYKAAECLWNTRHPGYRNRSDRIEASNKIIEAMNMPDFGHNELKNKIKNIRSTYAQELNKVKRASIGMEGGENYRTSLCWFAIADSFLRPMFQEEKKSGSANQERMERYFAMALAVGDLFSTWDEWCDTLREFEALTGHKFWKRRSRKVGAAKIRKELKPELVYYEVQLDCKIIHGLDCVDECPSDCSQRCPGTIKLRANEDGDQLRVSKLVLEGTHKDTIIYHNHEVQNKKTVTTNPFADEDNYITLQSILTTASVSGGNSPELYYPPLKVDAEIIKSEILEEDDTDEAEYHHQRKKARIDDTNGQVHLEVQESNDSVSGEVKIQDEFFYFGKNVECQLRHMQLDKALECQFKILEVLAQYRVPT